MIQVVQDIRSGETVARELPDPVAPAGGLLIANVASLVSAGTERMVVELAKKSLIGKARERPDHVRRVLEKLRQEGLVSTATQVLAKLGEPMPLGYSTAGVVLECGRGVQDFKPGDRVAASAPHAGIVAVGRNLVARIPDGVTFDQAAYAAVGAIAMEGVRLAKATLGERVLVVGLGLIGQIAVCLLKAQGCRVFGTDLDPAKLELAKSLGADAVGLGSPKEAVRAFAGVHGVDAVVITAATDSNEPIEFAADLARVKGRIVLVGVSGLNIPRPPFFTKELEFTVSGSLGPGRWDTQYEEKGIDYPFGHVRWTAQRNMEAVLDVIAQGRLPVEKLTTHRFPVERAADAYDLITKSTEPYLGVLLTYPPAGEVRRRRMQLRAPKVETDGELGVSVVGAGNFARLVLLPALARLGAKDVKLRGLCSARGLNAQQSGQKLGFEYAATDLDEVLADASTQAVFLVTRHDQHAEQIIACLRAGKHVFVEKPLCIREEELETIRATVDELGDDCPMIMVGFNRRFAKGTEVLKSHFAGVSPVSASFRFVAGELPAGTWPQDEDVGGGRIVGEACHAIDTVTALVGSPPVRVYAESTGSTGGVETTDDRVFITLRHANGAVSNVSYQAGGDKGGPRERIELFGGGRTATMNDWGDAELWRSGKREKASGGHDKGHASELRAFFQAMRAGSDWPISWEDLDGVAWASLAAVRSLREGAPQDRPTR